MASNSYPTDDGLSVGSMNLLIIIALQNCLPEGSHVEPLAGPERLMSVLELVQEVSESADLDWREYCAGIITRHPEAYAEALPMVCNKFRLTEAEIKANDEIYAELAWLTGFLWQTDRKKH